jgi:hypothetical protein
MRVWTVLSLVIAGMIVVAACGDAASGSAGLPTMPPTLTAVPPSTPTDIPEPDPVALASVDWNDIDQFRAAMRPAYAGDIDAFVNRNRYYIEATLTFENGVAVIRGAERVRYTNHSGDILNEIVFRLYPNLSALGGRMKVYRVELNDVPVEPVLVERESELVVRLDAPLQPGDSAEVMLQFSMSAEQGMNAGYGEFGFQKDVFSGPEWYPALSVYEEGRGWWTLRANPNGDAVYSESGLYEVFLTVPENFVVAMSGSEIETFPAGTGMKTIHNVSGPMRDSLIVAGPNLGKITEMVDDIAVNIYYWPGGEAAAESAVQFAADTVRTFNTTFGPYPYAEFDVAETFNWTGIEYPGIVIIADRFWEPGNPALESVIVHEAGHQWFYSLVGNNQVEHPWIDESLTSYSEYVYWRKIYDEEQYKEAIRGDRDFYNYYRGTGAPDLALNLPVSAYVDNNYGVIIYVKGPLFFAELENILGREEFFAGLQLYFKRHRYEVAESGDVLAAFEDATGKDLDAIFYEWVGEFEGLDPKVIEAAQQG